jgi:hypothetical protein
MAARKRSRHKSTGGTEARARRAACCAIAEGVVELRLGARVMLDVLVTEDGDLRLFLRVDGALVVAIPVLGEA